LKSILVSLSIFLLAGCAVLKPSPPPPLPAGFVNQYDADVFNGLVTANAAITQAKSAFAGTRAAKAPLNAAIKAYNDARAGYLAYHAAATANPSVAHTSLDNLVGIMLGAIAAIHQQFSAPVVPPSASRLFLPNRVSQQEAL
jgi:hypothetical protein